MARQKMLEKETQANTQTPGVEKRSKQDMQEKEEKESEKTNRRN
jgi:hypothetical protein